MILGTKEFLNAAQGSKLIDFKEIILIDYRGFLFDANEKDYFNVSEYKRDKSEIIKLNLTNRKRRK